MSAPRNAAAVASDPEEDEVRAHAPGVERSRRRLGGAAGGLDAVEAGQGLGEPARVGVVLGQPVDHPVRAVRQRDEPGRGQDAGLAHPAADQLAGAARAPDELASSPTTIEPTGQPRPFERQNVTLSAGPARSIAVTPASRWPTTAFQNRAPSTCSGTPCRGAISATCAGVGRGQRLAHRVGVGVLDGDEAGERLVGVVRVAEGVLDRGEVHRPVGPVLERADARADDDRVAGGLVDDHVVLAPAMISSPRRRCASCATRLPIVPEATNRPASLPSSSAARSSRAMTVGSSPKTSSPTSASAIARRMAGDGFVTVSLRRSIRDMGREYRSSVGAAAAQGPAREGQPGVHLLCSALATSGPVV